MKKRIAEILKESLDIDIEGKEDLNLEKEFGLDSLDSIELVMSIEEAFDVEIPDKDIAQLQTANDILKRVEELSFNSFSGSGSKK
jgi:acyl carrier protein